MQLSIVEEKKIDKDLLERYLNMRLKILLDNEINSLEKMDNREDWICMVLDKSGNHVKIDNLQAVYNEFKNIENCVGWMTFSPQFSNG